MKPALADCYLPCYGDWDLADPAILLHGPGYNLIKSTIQTGRGFAQSPTIANPDNGTGENLHARIFGRRGKPVVPGGLVGKLNLVDEIASKLATLYNEIASPSSIRERLQGIDAELREVWLGLDFVRTQTSCYVGDGIVLLSHKDEMPIFVNSNDMGGPFNLMNGGRYEEENLAVLLSFIQKMTRYFP